MSGRKNCVEDVKVCSARLRKDCMRETNCSSVMNCPREKGKTSPPSFRLANLSRCSLLTAASLSEMVLHSSSTTRAFCGNRSNTVREDERRGIKKDAPAKDGNCRPFSISSAMARERS